MHEENTSMTLLEQTQIGTSTSEPLQDRITISTTKITGWISVRLAPYIPRRIKVCRVNIKKD